MSISISILQPDEVRRFESPPSFTQAERQAHFNLTPEARTYFKTLRTPINQLGFILQYGYFRARGRFFDSKLFRTRDLQYLIAAHHWQTLKGRSQGEAVATLKTQMGGATSTRHRKEILRLQRWQEMEPRTQRRLEQHAQWQAEKQNGPAQLFFALVEYCWKNRWLIPSYQALSTTVTQCYQAVESRHLTIVRKQLDQSQQRNLLALLNKSERGRSLLTEAKSVDQSVRTRTMQHNAQRLSELKTMFYENLELTKTLNLTDQAVSYYAEWIVKATTHQVTQLSDSYKKCLYLMAFVKSQFYQRQDYAMDGVIKAVREAWNAASKQSNEEALAEKARHAPALNAVVQSQKQLTRFASDILSIIEDAKLSDKEKMELVRNRVVAVLSEQDEEFSGKVDLVSDYLEKEQSNCRLYDKLEKRAPSLIQKINSTLKLLVFDERDVEPKLWSAVRAFQLDQEIPVTFLSKTEQQVVSDNGKVRRPLCKLLLFKHMVDAVKGGELNLLYSFRYRSLQSYMIDATTWYKEKDSILALAGMTDYQDSEQGD